MIGWPHCEAPRKPLDNKDKLDTLLRVETGKLRRKTDELIFDMLMHGTGQAADDQ